MIDFVTALLSAPAIIALVNIYKQLGLPTKWAPVAAIVTGVGLSVSVWAWSDYSWFTAASSGLITALAASGLYDLALPGNNAARRAETENTDVSR